MKRRWRRFLFTLSVVIVAVMVAAVGVVVWLQQSGRLAQFAQDKFQQISGQEITLDAITFPSWNTIAVTDIRIQPPLPGWQVEVICPRLEAHFSLASLLNKTISALVVVQPTIQLHPQDTTSQAPGMPKESGPMALPVNRIHIQQGTLQIRHRDASYILEQIEASIQPDTAEVAQIEAQAMFGPNAATLQARGHIGLDFSQPSGDWQLNIHSDALPQLNQVLSGLIPPNWSITQGKLATTAEIELRDQMIQGTVHSKITQGHGTIADVAIDAMTLSTKMSINAQISPRRLTLKGTAQIQAERVNAPSELIAKQLVLETPINLTVTPEAWQLNVELAAKSQAFSLGQAVRLAQLSSTIPLTAQSTTHGWSARGNIKVRSPSVVIGNIAQPATQIVLDTVQVQLPIRATAATIELENTHLQAKDGRWFTADTTHLQSPVEIRVASQVDFKRQRFNLKHVDFTLPALGSIWGSGKWEWKHQTVRDLQIEFRPVTADVLWSRLSTWLPAFYQDWPDWPDWQVEGQTKLILQTQRLSWHPSAPPPWWSVTWHLDKIAFSSPEADIAAEHVSGILQARVKLPTATSPYEFDGRLRLKPFALLIGSFFPALEDNRVATNLTVTGTYHQPTPRLTLDIEGQFGTLGRLTVQGTLHRPSTSWHYEATCALQNLNATQIWKTIKPTAASDSTTESATPQTGPPAVSGELNADLTLRGQNASAHVQGQLNLTAFHFQSGKWALENATLKLPVDLRYPWPQTEPDKTTLPSTAYGRLRIARAQLGGLSIPAIDTPLALRSDSLFFEDEITLPLLDGQIRLQQLEAVRLLQPQRRMQMRLTMQDLNLQQLQRHSTKLPISGRVNAEFPRVQIDGTRLVTDGSLTLDVAGGRVRITDLHGHDLFSSIASLGASINTEAPLSLLQLTQIYPIGDIGGTLHFSLDDLIVTAGEPAAFHLFFRVQAKHGEKREITLKALNNLLFTTGSAKVDAGQAYRLPYKRFGAEITLRHDILRLRGLYHDKKGREYFMRAPFLGGVSIINRVPKNGVPFRSFIQRLKAAVLEQPAVRIK